MILSRYLPCTDIWYFMQAILELELSNMQVTKILYYINYFQPINGDGGIGNESSVIKVSLYVC